MKKGKKNTKSKSSEEKLNILRCINIDCIFNSSNDIQMERNFCSHPNLNVESHTADITIAICSEFRSKKDYSFQKPDTVKNLTTGETQVIEEKQAPTFTKIEKVTTEELESEYTAKKEKPLKSDEQTVIEEKPEVIKPNILELNTEDKEAYLKSLYRLTDDKTTDFLILQRLYKPNLKKGFILSVIAHIIFIVILIIVISDEENHEMQKNNQRIVVVEDIEQPKFNPPDIDKIKEEDLTLKTETDENVRPKIIPKTIKPRIKRPKDNVTDTTELTKKNNDSLKAITDSLLALNKGDTTRLEIADSLKSTYSENEIGLSLWYPKNWKLRDNRDVNLELEKFKGVIINTDSLSEDPGAVTIFIQIDDPKYSAYNKTTFKNIFEMEDSLSTAYSTDPTLTGAKKIKYQFYIFSDPTGQQNIFVNSEIKKDLFEKYKKYIEAIVRSIKIVSKPKNP